MPKLPSNFNRDLKSVLAFLTTNGCSIEDCVSRARTFCNNYASTSETGIDRGKLLPKHWYKQWRLGRVTTGQFVNMKDPRCSAAHAAVQSLTLLATSDRPSDRYEACASEEAQSSLLRDAVSRIKVYLQFCGEDLPRQDGPTPSGFRLGNNEVRLTPVLHKLASAIWRSAEWSSGEQGRAPLKSVVDAVWPDSISADDRLRPTLSRLNKAISQGEIGVVFSKNGAFIEVSVSR